ncbi:MAG: hypothetical protein AAGF71_07465 [Pseudomonadota bacterium]
MGIFERTFSALGLSLICIASAGHAAEDALLTGDRFGAYVSGSTVTFAHNDQVYGMEQYMPGNHVIWRRLGGDCQEGTWFAQGDEICFDYGEGVPLQCWQFYQTATGLRARSMNDASGMWLYEVMRTDEPMQCPAPYLGA